MTYTLYATTENGHGYCEKVGTYDSLSEISIRVGLFSPDVVLTIEEKKEELEK